MLPNIAYLNIWEQSHNFVTRENKSENVYLTCKCYLLINICHRVIFDIWHVRDIHNVLLFPLSAPPTFWKVIMLSHTAQKMKFPIRDSSVNVTKSTSADLVTFTEEILHFLCSAKLLGIHTMSYLTLSIEHLCFLTRTFFPDNSHILG